MNISNMKNFVNAKNDILKCFAHAVAQATHVSVVGARIYRWRNEMFRRHVAQTKRIFINTNKNNKYIVTISQFLNE